MDDRESTSGMTFLSQSTKSHNDQLTTRRLHSWTMLRTWLNREISKEVVSAINSGGTFDTKGRFMFPPDTMTTDLLLEPSSYRRGAKMQSKFGASILSSQKQQQLANSTYFVYGIPRVRPSCLVSDTLTVDLNVDEENVQTVDDPPLRDSYLKKSIARSNREQTEYDEMKMRASLGLSKKRLDTEYDEMKMRASLGLSKKRLDTEYDDAQMRTTFSQSKRNEEEKGNSKYGASRLGKSYVSRETKQKDEEEFYFGGFGGKSQKEDPENSKRIGDSQFRQSFRNDNDYSSSLRPGPEDSNELRQSRRPPGAHQASGIYARHTKNPYLDEEEEPIYSTKITPRAY